MVNFTLVIIFNLTKALSIHDLVYGLVIKYRIGFSHIYTASL